MNLDDGLEAFEGRNDAIQLYHRDVVGNKARIFNLTRRVAPRIRRAYLRWLGTEILWNERTVEYMVATKMVPPPPARVLDVGSTSSRWPIQLASLGHPVTSIDVRRYAFAHPNLEVVTTDLFDWTPEAPFDCITAISTVEHFGLGHYGDNPRERADVEAMARFRDWMSPEAVMILSVPFGVAGETPKHRIYDAPGLSDLCAGYELLEERYFRRDGEAWLPCEAAALTEVASSDVPVSGVVIRKLGLPSRP